MEMKELLPIGSIVLLEEGTKRLMIYGIKQIESETREEYDYIGVVYPEGNMGEGTQFLFNHENIREVCFVGYKDEEWSEFMEKLSEYYKQKI